MKHKIMLSMGADIIPNYINAVKACGAEACPFYLPPPSAEGYDALILSGGGDVEPSLYGENNTASFMIDRERDAAESALINAFIAAGKPVLGICRGQQILNVTLGGTLIQHISTADRHVGKDGRDAEHGSTAAEGCIIHKLYGLHPKINSWHHQAIDIPAPGFIPVQWSDDGIIESCVYQNKPVYAVQWHPERMCLDFKRNSVEDGLLLFDWFINEII
jgi:putative glutamine amidotransferase